MQLLDEHLWSMYQKGMIAAEDMVDKAKNPGDLTDRVHRMGQQVGRAELDEEEEKENAEGTASGG
jgi:Tfp pilus assembly ATPase PilU